MKNLKILYIIAQLIYTPMNFAWQNCDLTHFRWECDLPIYQKKSRAVSSLVYCGNSYGYMTRFAYEQLANYQRTNMNMVLKVNDEYVESPCVLADQ